MTGRTIETTVTYLILQTMPATVPPIPSRPPLTVTKAELIPLHFYRYLYATVGRPWLWIERLFLSDAALAARVHRDGVEVHVAYANGSPAGFYELDFSVAGKADLAYFGLTPEWIGHKVGPWLLGTAVAEAFSRGIGRLTVNTCTLDHPAALPLYQRLGFRPVNQQIRRFTLPEGFDIPVHQPARMAP